MNDVHHQPFKNSLLFNIGFAGASKTSVYYRSLGSQSTPPPAIGNKSILAIHPTYAEALNLREALMNKLDPSMHLAEGGLLPDLPEGTTADDYNSRLQLLQEQFKTTPVGEKHAEEFANLIGEVVRRCLFRALTNLEPKVRNEDGRVIRDWIASNHAPEGFWEVIRTKYGATQIVFECKNYAELEASDFHQVAYYMNETIGQFAVLVFRGAEVKRHRHGHVRRIASEKRGMILLLTERDIGILLRQALNGKSSESHLQELYDRAVREAS